MREAPPERAVPKRAQVSVLELGALVLDLPLAAQAADADPVLEPGAEAALGRARLLEEEDVLARGGENGRLALLRLGHLTIDEAGRG